MGWSLAIKIPRYKKNLTTPVVDDIQASVTDNTMKESASEKKSPNLLQEEEEEGAQEANDDYNVNAEANKVYQKKNRMVVTLEEEKKTME